VNKIKQKNTKIEH